MDQKYINRFHTKYSINPVTGCWQWQANTDEAGYGRYYYIENGKEIRIGAHRFSMLLAGHSLIPKQVVMHTCDNTSCVNPKHLSMGTNSDNMQDMVRKGRNACFKLNSEDVRHIRQQLDNALSLGQTVIALAKQYNVSTTNIRDIHKRNIWKKIS